MIIYIYILLTDLGTDFVESVEDAAEMNLVVLVSSVSGELRVVLHEQFEVDVTQVIDLLHRSGCQIRQVHQLKFQVSLYIVMYDRRYILYASPCTVDLFEKS